MENPIRFDLTGGQTSDLEEADDGAIIIADKGYGAQERVVAPLLKQGKQAVIPSRKNCKEKRKCDWHLYKARHLVENFFARLKQYRCISTRYDKTACAFLGGIHLDAAIF